MTKTAKTTVAFKGTSIPFYRTIRGQYDFENAGFTNNDMAAGKVSAMYAFVYFQMRDCAKRAGIAFKLTLNEYIDQADGELLLEAYVRLLDEEKKLKSEGESEPGKSGTVEFA